MRRYKLKKGGRCRDRAIFGAAIGAGATLAAAGIQAAATASAAEKQAKAAIENAKNQAQTIREQTQNSNRLQQEALAFTRQQNQENRQQQQDMQMTLQMMAGKDAMNDIMSSQKAVLKLGGQPRMSIAGNVPFYGGASTPFTVTDGGGVLPIATDIAGNGLYELIGNDHDHYHKAPGGKHKTGVGIKFNDGTVVEGEGNQNTNQGELLYVTPDDAMFISKHTIAGFNPALAVKNGVHPKKAFAIQEMIKASKGLNDDGTKKRKSIKKSLGGYNVLNNTANLTQNPFNSNIALAAGGFYPTNNKAKLGKRIKLKSGGFWNNYGGAFVSGVGNLIGGGINWLGTSLAGNTLSNAYNTAGETLANAYRQMKGIDMSELKMEDYQAPKSLAVIRSANTNINPQLERLRRNAKAEQREINRGTMSSAARQQRLAAVNDRMMQRMSEQYSYKDQLDEQIRQGNAERITQTAQANADREAEARRNYATQRLSLLQYNNNIENSKLAGIAQAQADALTQGATAKATALQSGVVSLSAGLTAAGAGFASTADGIRQEQANLDAIMYGADTENQINYLIQNPNVRGNYDRARNLYNVYKNSDNATLKGYATQLNDVYKFDNPISDEGNLITRQYHKPYF